MASSISYVAIFLAITFSLTLNISTVAMESSKKEIRLHFYLQERAIFPNATIIKVVSSPIGKSKNTTFGDILVFDDYITEDSDPKSRLLGRGRGMLAITQLDGSAGLLTSSLAFTDIHPWSGSSLTIMGHFSFTTKIKETQEVPVVGGTGRFRFAQGYALYRRVSSNDVNIRTFETELVLFIN